MSDLIARPDTIWAYQFRIVLLGDSTVGKSALLQRFTDGCFYEVSKFSLLLLNLAFVN